MNNIQLMQISDSTYHLFKISTCFIFLNFRLFYNIIKEFPFLNVLHNKKQMSWCLNNLLFNKKYTSYNWMMLGWRINLRIWIYRDTRYTSATSMIFYLTKIFIATFYPVNVCVASFTLPNVPSPIVLPFFYKKNTQEVITDFFIFIFCILWLGSS